MLQNPYARENGELVPAKKGILAGSPVSGFLANLFLADLDRYFENNQTLYARYSDDIIIFSASEPELLAQIGVIRAFLAERALRVNEAKEFRTAPGEGWTFLGFFCRDDRVDIAEKSKRKLKKKMKRKARALIRWKRKKGAEPERAVRAYLRYFNRKLYDNPVNNELTWCRWYFPLITTADSLKELDAYMQQCVRAVATEKNTKARFNFTYEQMRACGYRTLVHSYYDFRKNGADHGAVPAPRD